MTINHFSNMTVSTTGTDAQGQAEPSLDATLPDDTRKVPDAACDGAGRTTDSTTVIPVTCADCGQSTGPLVVGRLSGQTFHEDVTYCIEALKRALDAATAQMSALEAWLREGRDADGQDRWICAPISATGPIVARGHSTDDIVADTLAQLADQLVTRAGA